MNGATRDAHLNRVIGRRGDRDEVIAEQMAKEQKLLDRIKRGEFPKANDLKLADQEEDPRFQHERRKRIDLKPTGDGVKQGADAERRAQGRVERDEARQDAIRVRKDARQQDLDDKKKDRDDEKKDEKKERASDTKDDRARERADDRKDRRDEVRQEQTDTHRAAQKGTTALP